MIRSQRDDGRCRIGFTLIGGPRWAGGLNYLYTVLHAVSHDLSDRFSACLLISQEDEDLARQKFGGLADVHIIVDPRACGAGAGRRAVSALLTGRDALFAHLVSEQHIDLVFETARFFGFRFPVPVLSWIPDFQHRHLPWLFSRRAWWKRDIGFRAQCAGRRIVLLSSRTAERDCHRFYPSARGRTHVARFAATLDIAKAVERAATVRATYAIPDRFLFLPNQFWIHKNHRVVIDSLRHLKAEGTIDQVMPVILSGHTQDPRRPHLFSDSMRAADEAGIDGWFRHLGAIPYEDVLALNAASQGLLNPSLFEGWSTTLEEAKALGTPLILSDIPTHREQAAAARFFEADDPRALAQVLLDVSQQPDAQRLAPENLAQSHAQRHADFVVALRHAFDAASMVKSDPAG